MWPVRVSGQAMTAGRPRASHASMCSLTQYPFCLTDFRLSSFSPVLPPPSSSLSSLVLFRWPPRRGPWPLDCNVGYFTAGGHGKAHPDDKSTLRDPETPHPRPDEDQFVHAPAAPAAMQY